MKERRPTSLAWQRGAGFTLTELLVAIALLAILVVVLSQFVTHGATIVRSRSKQLDTDAHGRAVLDRIGADLDKMMKRTDIDYYVKQPGAIYAPGNSGGHSQGKKAGSAAVLNDQIAFFAEEPGYYPTSSSTAQQSPISLLAYRVNGDATSTSYLKLERMSKGLLWTGVSNAVATSANSKTTRDIPYPIVFSPGQIAAKTGPWMQPWGPWAAAITNGSGSNSGSQDPDYEVLSRQVFRFEYYYLLKNGNVSSTPWDTAARPAQTSLTSPQSIGLADIEALCVSIAAIDSASRSLIPSATLFDIASDLADFQNARGNGVGAQKSTDVDANWNAAIRTIVANGRTSSNTAVPPTVASAIRVYSRQFSLGGL